MFLLGWYSAKQRRIHQILHGRDCAEIWWWTSDGNLSAVTMVTASETHPFDQDAVCVGIVTKHHRPVHSIHYYFLVRADSEEDDDAGEGLCMAS